MKTLKRLLLTALLICTSSSFANTGGGGFDDPIKLFNFYIDLAEKAMKYRIKHGDYNPTHIKKLAPHVYAANKKYLASARAKLSGHEHFVRRSKRGNHPFIVDIKQLKPYFDKYEGTVSIPYTYYRYQQKKVNGKRDKARYFQAKVKKIGNQIKWYVYL